jgi:hypothetical protein
VERFSILSDPPIARTFAEMASRPSLPHSPEPVARRRTQPLGFHDAVFRSLRRAPDVIAPPGKDAPRSRPAHSQRPVYRKVALRHVVECKGSSA